MTRGMLFHRNRSLIQGRFLLHYSHFFLALFSILIVTSTIHAETLTLHPSGKNTLTTGWTFTPSGSANEANDLDSNDGDTSYASSTALNDKLYMNLDTTTLSGWTINSVQVFAVAKVTGSSTSIQVGLRVGSSDSDRLGSSRSIRSSSYRSYSGSLYTTNPKTSAPWAWSDISSLIPMVLHASNGNALRVTELFVQVNYTKAISPSGKDPLSTGWTFCNATPTCSANGTGSYADSVALDANDGDSSFARSTALNDKLYIDFDDFPNSTSQITGVRLNVVAKCATNAMPCNFEIGIRTNGTDFVNGFDSVPGAGTIYSGGGTTIFGNATNFTSQLAVNSQITANGQTRTVTAVNSDRSLTINAAFLPQLPTNSDSAVPFTFVGGTTTYQTFTSDFFTHNPATLAPWTWSDINSLMGVINHVTNANEVRVTQVYLSINYINPVALSYTPDTNYGSTSGVYPSSGGATTSFTYKVIYTNLNNNPPTSIKIYIDNDGGHTMTRDTNAENADFSDLDYTNGEQYTYTAASLSSGQHTYYFAASDVNGDSAQKPASGTLAGPGVTIPAGSDDIFPSAQEPITTGDWGFTGGDASTALTTNDGNTSYVDDNPSDQGETLYLDMATTGLTGSITAVQVSAAMCSTSSTASVRLGLRLNGSDYTSAAFNVSAVCGTYTVYTPTSALFKTNPDTGKPWTWDDINNMIGIVLNESTNTFRVTQFKVTVTHTPVILSFSDDPGYDSIDGVNPDSGNSSTSFTYKVIYSNANGTAPAAGYPKLHIDGNATGVSMTLDTNASDPTLYDGDYINGQQYTYTYTGGFPTGTTRSYYFDASDGSATVTFPPSGNFSGPAISLPAGSFILYPTDVVDGTSGFSLCNSGFRQSDCFDSTTALRTNDGDTSYSRGRRSDDYLYVSLDNPRANGQYITSVQVSAVVRAESGTINFTLGLSIADNLVEGSGLSTSSTSYVTLDGTAYGYNPITGAPWTWSDIQNLVAVVHHTNNSRMRVTQIYVTVGYGPVQLQYSSDPGYLADGVQPDLGNTSTSFKFKVIYYNVNNVAPASNNPKVHIDGDAGHTMSLDTTAAAALHDGNYANGEQYVYTTTLATANHSYTYYFDASDGTNTGRLPAGTATFSGPYVALNGAAPNLNPTGLTSSSIAATTGWTFCNSTPTCSASGTGTYANTVALDTNDGDTSFARSLANGDRLYMEIDPPPTLPNALSITSVQVSIVARDTSSSTTTGVDFGLRLGITDFLSGTTKTPPDAYGTLSGTVYTTNPATGENWTWNDINGMGAVIVHQTNNNEVRVTQLYLTVTYSPIQLTFATDPRYFDDGVDPNGGTAGTTFSYRIVYTQAFGVAPAAGYPKVHIDGNATGVAMTLDTQAPAALQDGDFTNGEQYVYTTNTLAAQGAPHNYYFDVSDGTNTARTPLSGTLSGPVVSAKAPTLSFANQTGYTLRSPGTGTLTTSGTTTVTGTGTSFTTQLQVGTTITAAGGQTRTVTAIASNTSLTIDTPFSPDLSGATFAYAAWSGTGTLTTSGTTTVTGTGTSFQSQLQVGSTITAAGQTRTVMAIASNTSLTVDSAFSPNLSGATFTFFTDLPLRGVEPNTGTVNTPFTFKIVYTDADNNPPVTGYPRLLLDYNTTVYAMNPDTGATVTGMGTISSSSTTVTGSGTNFLAELVVGDTITASGQTKTVTAIASATSLTVNSAFSSNLPSGTTYTHNGLSDGNYTNGEQYTVTVYLTDPGTHAYSFDATDGVTPVIWPLNGDGFLAPSVTDTVSSGVIIYPISRNAQTTGFSFLGNDQDPSTALGIGYPGNGTISNASGSTTVTGVGTNFTTMSVGSIITAGAPQQKQRVTAIANDTSLTTATAFSPNLSGASWLYDGDYSYARATRTGNNLYMNMDEISRSAAAITSVQFFAIIRDTGSNNINFSVGLQIGGTDYTSSYTTPGNSTYTTYSGNLYTTNPKTGSAWTWDDVTNLLGVVKLTRQDCFNFSGCNEIRVTQMYIRVNYQSLPILSYSPEAGYYGTDGVDPDGWNPAHIYTYKIVYASGANFAPTSIQVFIDGVGYNMSHDGAFITNDPLRNGDYTDGEQFYYSTSPNQLAVGPHNYYFQASDGSNTYRLPTSGTLPGPNVSVNEPFLTFSSASGYGTVGVNPGNGESGSQQFTYKVVYTHPDNNRPLYVKVHIDGDAGRLMSVDSSASATLKDGNYVNGEQYTYTTTLGVGSHTYLFEATDGAKQIFLPLIPSLGILSGPTVTNSIAPNAVTNLAISGRTPTSTTLTWTAPGDAGTGAGCPCGTVASYNIRYSTLMIVDDSVTPASGQIQFSNATGVTGPPSPQPAGGIEIFTVTGLNPNTPYYFAMKSTDAGSLTSLLSNVVNSGNSPPIPATNLISGWNMVSVPMTPNPADVATVFGSSVGVPVNIMKWVSTGLGNQNGSFSLLSGTDTVQPGAGYFIQSPDDSRFLNPAGTANSAATFSISLTQGWNMIGNPYTKDVNLDTTCVSQNGGTGTCTASVNLSNFKSFANAVAAGWVGNALYQWNGTTYTFNTYNDPTQKAVLRLWQGYWLQVIDANGANTYKLIVVKP